MISNRTGRKDCTRIAARPDSFGTSTFLPAAARALNFAKDSTRTGSILSRLPVNLPTIASPRNCCHQLSVWRSYITRSEFRSLPVVPKSSTAVQPPVEHHRGIAQRAEGHRHRHPAHGVVDDLVPHQDSQGIGADVAVDCDGDHRLAIWKTFARRLSRPSQRRVCRSPGMPSRGGPPENISRRSTECLEKSAFREFALPARIDLGTGAAGQHKCRQQKRDDTNQPPFGIQIGT